MRTNSHTAVVLMFCAKLADCRRRSGQKKIYEPLIITPLITSTNVTEQQFSLISLPLFDYNNYVT